MKGKITKHVSPNEFNRQRQKDRVPVCDHLSSTEQAAAPMRCLPKKLQPDCRSVLYCSRCLQKIVVTLGADTRPEVAEIDE